MASVSDLVRATAEVVDLPFASINVYARQLIDGGILPKSRGRQIAPVWVDHAIALLTCIALEPKSKEAVRETELYLELPLVDVENSSAPVPHPIRFQQAMKLAWNRLISEDDEQVRRSIAESQVWFVRNFVMAEIRMPRSDGDVPIEEVYRFKPQGQKSRLNFIRTDPASQHPRYDSEHLRRCTVFTFDILTLLAIKLALLTGEDDFRKVFHTGGFK